MPIKHILFIFFIFYIHILPIYGQDATLDWQEQILHQVDVEDLGEEAYDELLEHLSELTVWSDTTPTTSWLRQQVVLSSNRCLNVRAGYKDQSEEKIIASKAYRGDPWNHRVRYRAQYGQHWQAGFILTKEGGERWQKSLPVFDGWHAFVRARNIRVNDGLRIRDAIAGHYRLRLGCGLVMSQGFSLGKQFSSQRLWQAEASAISPHTSASESDYMQGVAADLRLGQHLTLLPYLSLRQLDGTLSDKHILTALQTTGYHRTQSEESHRQQAWQTIMGTRLGWRGEWYEVGLHASYTQLQYDYIRQANYYNLNYFRGHQLINYAADYTVRALGCQFRGEFSMDDGGAIASLNAVRTEISDTWTAALTHRYYSTHYRQLHAHSIAESSGLQGEQGLTLVLDGSLSRRLQLMVMADWFLFNQPQYGIRDEHSQGFEANLRLNYTRKNMEAWIGYKGKIKGDYIRHTMDGSFRITPMPSLSLRSQLRTRIYSKENEDPTYGYALSQAVAWQCDRWKGFPFTLEGQATYFHTDDYESRVYLTERTILYGFGLPMLYGEGVRYSVTATAAIGKRWHIDLKYALSNYANRNTIGSGLQQISGNSQHDLWLQLRMKL